MRTVSSFSLVFLGMVLLLASASLPMQGLAKLSARAPVAGAHPRNSGNGESGDISDVPVRQAPEVSTEQDPMSLKMASHVSSANGTDVQSLFQNRTMEHGPGGSVELLSPSYVKRLRVVNDTPVAWNFTARYFQDPVPHSAGALEKARYRYDVEVAGGESYLFPERVEKVGTYFIVVPVRHVTVYTSEGLEFDSLNLDKHVSGVHNEASVIFRSPAAEKPPTLVYSDL